MIVTHCNDCKQSNRISPNDRLSIESGLTHMCEWCGSTDITMEYGAK